MTTLFICEIIMKLPPFGTSLDKLLKEKFNLMSILRFANDMGIPPNKLLEEKSMSTRLWSSQGDIGIGPSSAFKERFKYSNSLQPLIPLGMYRVNWFAEISIAWTIVILLNPKGMGPCNKLFEMFKYKAKFARYATLGGMGTLSKLYDKSRSNKFVHFPRFVGISPNSQFLER